MLFAAFDLPVCNVFFLSCLDNLFCLFPSALRCYAHSSVVPSHI